MARRAVNRRVDHLCGRVGRLCLCIETRWFLGPNRVGVRYLELSNFGQAKAGRNHGRVFIGWPVCPFQIRAWPQFIRTAPLVDGVRRV